MKMHTTTWPSLLALMIFLVPCVSAQPSRTPGRTAVETQQVSDLYMAATGAGKLDELPEILSPDSIFLDPTAEVFPGPAGQGPVKGAEAIVAMMTGWRIAKGEHEAKIGFVEGEYAVFAGPFTCRYIGGAKEFKIPLVTILRVENDRVTERLDFGEYTKSMGLGSKHDDVTAATRKVAEQYVKAYQSGDLEYQIEVLHPEAVAQDPTAKVFGPPSGERLEGAETILARRRKMYATIPSFELEVKDSFVQYHHAVFMGTLRYEVSGQTVVQAAIFAVEVREGKVTRHWDFVDYFPDPKQGGAR